MKFICIIKSFSLGVMFATALVCVFLVDFVKAQGQKVKTEISGKIIGSDGKPILRATVIISPSPNDKSIAMTETDQVGNFSLSINKTGLFVLGFVGINHPYESAVLIIDKPRKVKLNVRLAAAPYRDDFSEGTVVSENVRGAIGLLKKQPDGTYLAEFESKEKSVEYVISKISKKRQTINGTQAENYKLHESGTIYFSIATPVDGKVRIILDPTKLLPYTGPANFNFGESNLFDNKLNATYREMEERLPGPQQAPATPTLEEIAKVTNRIAKEKNPVLKKMLWLDYLDLTLPTGKADALLTAQALDSLTPKSPFWVLRYNLITKAITATNQPNKYSDYTNLALESLPEQIKIGVMAQVFWEAMQNKQYELAEAYLLKFAKEYPNHPLVKAGRATLDTNKTVVVGKTIPAFTFHSFDDPNVIYTPAIIKAKVYLIDFWATWCHPCLDQMPYLHQAYQKFHDKGFEILSYSLDTNHEVVKQFRKGRNPMPWLHAIDPQLREKNEEVYKQFELIGIPAAFLVGADGKILATRFDIDGDNLEKILAKILGKPENAKP